VGAGFNNDGGTLGIKNMNAQGVTAASLISTANNGVSFLQYSTVSNSSLGSVTYATAGGSQSVISSQVQSMKTLNDAFFAEGAGSQVTLSNSQIRNNNIVNGTGWRGVTIQGSASGSMDGTSISGNQGMTFAASASGSGSTLSMANSNINNNVAPVSLYSKSCSDNTHLMT
jgi:hypothetical protein